MAKFLGSKAKGATPRKATDGMSLFAAMLIGGVLTLAIAFFLYLWNPFNQGKTLSTDAATPAEQAKAQTKVNGDPNKPDYEFYDLLPEQKITGLPNQAIGDKAADAANPNITPDVVVNAKVKSRDAASGTANTVKAGGKKPNAGEESADSPNSIADAANPNDTDTDGVAQNSANAKPANDQSKASIQDVDSNRRFILQINSFKNAEDADKRRAQVLIAGVDAQIVKKPLADGTLIYQVISHTMTSEQAVAEAQNRLQDNGIDSLIVEQRVAK